MTSPQHADDSRLDDLRRTLDEAHGQLLGIHKALIDHERARYEQSHSPVGGPVQFLEVLIHDPFFAWLRPMSAIIVQIDEFTSSKEAPSIAEGEALLVKVRRLMTPAEAAPGAFAREYYRAIQESPEVASLHGQWRRTAGA